MRDNNVVLAVRWCTVDYLRPAVLDDHLVIETSLQRLVARRSYPNRSRQEIDLVRIDLKWAASLWSAARLLLAVRAAII